MEALFLSVLEMSLTAGYVILVILLARLPLKRVPRAVSYGLWAAAAFRLLCPVSLTSVFSLLPSAAASVPRVIVSQARQGGPAGTAGTAAGPAMPAVIPAAEAAADGAAGITGLLATVFAYLWFAGMAVLLVYGVASALLLKRRLSGARPTEPGVYEADNLKTPFVLGVLRPKIYLPAGLAGEERGYILLHERTHIRRGDHVIKPLAYFTLSLHWFNPLVWAAFLLMSADMELACDERVLRILGGEVKKPYAASLLSLAAGRRIPRGSPLAFGEGNVRGRIKNVLHYKKPAFRVVLVSVAAVIAVGTGLLANPVDGGQDLSFLKPGNLLSTISDQERIRITSSQYGETYVSGVELAKWLDIAENGWSKKLISPAREPEPSVVLHIDDRSNQQIRFFGEAPDLALVVFGDDRRYYKIPKEDYELMLEAAQLGTPGVESVTVTEYADHKDASAVTVTEEELIRRLSVLVLKGEKKEPLLLKLDLFTTSVNDVPPVADYIRLDFSRPSDGRALTYFVYSDGDRHYVERPYGRVYTVGETTLEAIAALCKGEAEGPAFVESSSPPLTGDLEQSIGSAIISHYEGDPAGRWYETAGEGHITLETERRDGLTYAYVWEKYYRFSFVNGNLTHTGGHSNPATLVFRQDSEGRYVFLELIRPRDGSEYWPSIEEMFSPSAMEKLKSFNLTENSAALDARAEEYGRAYLALINREAEVHVRMPEQVRPELHVEVSNYLLDAYGEYPYWIGTRETMENGVRYVYETGWEKQGEQSGVLTFTKRVYQAGVEEQTVIRVDGSGMECIKGTLRPKDYYKKSLQ